VSAAAVGAAAPASAPSAGADLGKAGVMAELVAEATKVKLAGTELQVYGESRYDQVISMMLACVVSGLAVVGVLTLIHLTNNAFRARVPAAVELIEFYGTGGGDPEGEVGAVETVNVPGAAAGEHASNNPEEASEFEEPALERVSSTVLDALANSNTAIEADVAESIPSGGVVASGRRASRIGTGARAYGFGPGDGTLPPWQRWSIVYNPGLTIDEYARQLDALGVELGVTSGTNTVEYGSNFSSNPTRRSGLSQAEGRIYFLPQNRTWRENDAALLARCGIQVGDRHIFQFYPRGVEQTLAQLERAHQGRQAAEIRTTRFAVVPQGNSYTFRVQTQVTLR
jgi:hypothetical protein